MELDPLMPTSTSPSLVSALTPATLIARNLLTKFALKPDFLEDLQIAFGDDFSVSDALALQTQWLNADFASFPSIEIRHADELQGAFAAYAAVTNTILINQDFLQYAAPEQLTAVLLEEIGHSLDAQLNPHDTPGDEGAIFSKLVQGSPLGEIELLSLQAENDWTTIWLDGVALAVEKSNTANAGPLIAASNNVQPFLGLSHVVVNQGIFPSREGGSVVGTFIGEVVMFAGGPNIGLSASGQVLQIAPNTALFSLLGTNYGGNGQTTFALPDLRGRIPVGAGNGPGLTPRTLGAATGSEQFSVTYPSHNHTVNASGTGTGAVSTTVNASNIQPELPLNYIIATEGVFPSRDSGGGGEAPYIGEVTLFAGNFAPSGWQFADGQLLSIAQNSALFVILGTTYGGDGVTTFALPDLRGRTAVSSGTGPGLTNRTLGETGGTETISATPSHTHSMNAFGSSTTSTNTTPVPVNNVQPFTTLNYIVSLQGIFPTFGEAVPTEQFVGEVRLFAGNFAPRGWALADGQLLSISQNTALFSLLGTSYGGNGQTTFALPDLRGRSPVNPGTGTGLTARSLGERGGTESESLAWPNHVHTITYPAVNLSVSSNTATEANTTVITVTATAAEAVSGNQTVTLGVTGTGITTGDYNLSNTTITIANGQTTGTVTFTVVNDTLPEGIETATLTISNPTAGIQLGATTSQTITIADNDFVNQVDFNKDSNNDLFWHNGNTGEIAFWAMNGTTFVQGQVIETIPIATGWKPVGAGDFTGDGNTDILLRNSITGENGFWTMNGTAITSYVQLDFVPANAGWDVIGVGDFTNDGKADVLWRNQVTGENGIWGVNGAAVTSYTQLDFVPVNTGWDAVGVGDFNGDRNTDILWRNRNTSENAYWEMNGTTYVAFRAIEPVSVASGWNVAGVGDFNRDSRADIIWRNSLDGQAEIWEMNGNVKTGVVGLLPTVSPSTGWNIV